MEWHSASGMIAVDGNQGNTFPCITVDTKVETLQWLGILRGVENLCRTAAYAAVKEGGQEVLLRYGKRVELVIVLADDTIVQALNSNYRGQNKPTNVLSFATLLDVPSPLSIPCEALALGDIIIALQTTMHEAEQQAIPLANHLQHLVIHGTLHLLGYDHQADAAAEAMEYLETRILTQLGIADPYCNVY